jgi:hypothetical protein
LIEKIRCEAHSSSPSFEKEITAGTGSSVALFRTAAAILFKICPLSGLGAEVENDGRRLIEI